MSMVIGIDLDGVMYPYTDVLRWCAEKRYGIKLQEPTTWDFMSTQWGITMERFHAITRESILDGELFWYGDPEEHSIQTLQRLKADGHSIVIVTHREPQGAEQEARWATEFWLASHRVPHDSLIIGADKTGLGLDVLLDDAPHNIEAARAAGERAIIYDRPWNRGIPGERVSNWREFYDIVVAR